MPRRPTLRDVSDSAGVSTYAASQALAGKPGVSDSTRQRVVEAAKLLGYVPNRVAASLKDNTTRIVGVMTASGRNQYYAMLVQAMDAVLQIEGYHAVTNDAMRGNYDVEREHESLEELLQQRVAAIVTTYSLSPASMDLLAKWNVPVLFVDSPPPAGYENYPFVGSDNYRASKLVAEHLGTLGTRSALLVAFPADWSTRGPRERGFTEAAADLGIDTTVLEVENTSEGAYRDVLAALDGVQLPDAIYATNIVLLQGTLTALKKLGISVPADVSVVGFDEFDWSDLIDPPMTVVDQHIDEIGTSAGRSIIDIIEQSRAGTPRAGIHEEIEPHLVVRESSLRRISARTAPRNPSSS